MGLLINGLLDPVRVLQGPGHRNIRNWTFLLALRKDRNSLGKISLLTKTCDHDLAYPDFCDYVR